MEIHRDPVTLIHVGGHPASWDTEHHIRMLIFNEGSCSVAYKKYFNLTVPDQAKEFSEFVTGLPVGTIVTGLIGPGLSTQMDVVMPVLSSR